MTKQVLPIMVIALLALPALARIGWYPDFDELSQKSDVIVIAEDLGVRDLTERIRGQPFRIHFMAMRFLMFGPEPACCG